MTHIESSLLAVALPDFLIRFKDACLNQLLPLIEAAIDTIQRADNSILIVLLLILFVQLLRLALVQRSEGKSEGVAPEQRQLGKEIKDLKKQFKSIQTMLMQLKAMKVGVKQEGGAGNRQAIQQIMNSCRSSLSRREEVSDNILDWQTKIIEEVTKLKKKRATASRLSVSSIPKQTVYSSLKKNAKVNVTKKGQMAKPAFRSEITREQRTYEVILTNQPAVVKEVVREQITIEKEDHAVPMPIVNLPPVEHAKIQEAVVVQPYIIEEVRQTYQKVQVSYDTPEPNTPEQNNQDLIQQPFETMPRSLPNPPLVKPPPRAKMGLPKNDLRKQPPPPPIRRA